MEGILKSDALEIKLLKSGDIERITYDKVMCINLYKANIIGGMIGNIYLRITESGKWTRLLGIHSPSSFKMLENEAIYEGEFEEISYRVSLILKDYTWFYTVSLGEHSSEVEIYYAMDISLSYFRANEAYSSQYLDHSISENYSITTRQNQGSPFSLMQGSFNKIESFATDGYQFFGSEYKITNIPRAMKEGSLPSYNYQYELAMASFKVKPEKGENKVVFFSDFISDFNQKSHRDVKDIKSIYDNLELSNASPDKKIKSIIDFDKVIVSKSLTSKEINSIKNKDNLEYDDDKNLISFFRDDHSHWVLKEKEALLERPTANLCISNGYTKIPERTYTSTSYVYGIFLSHIAYGNTDMNGFISTVKDPLNLDKTTGVRIFIKVNGEYRLLTMPAVFEMKASLSKWTYLIEDDEISIQTVMEYAKPNAKLSFKSKNKRSYECLVVSNLSVGPEESTNVIKPIFAKGMVEYSFDKDNLAGKYQSDYHFSISVENGNFSFKDASYLNKEERDLNRFLVMEGKNSSFIITFSGQTDGINNISLPFNQIEKDYEKRFLNNIHNFSVESADQNIMKFNHLVYWYSHDALIHYASPHGLEQYSGAAWGTRDLSQGPIEFFKVMFDYDMVRYIIERLYSRQFSDTYDWPQWFMFDNYSFIEAQDSHGDVIVWPLKVIGDYLNETNDLSILDMVVPYTDRNNGKSLGKDTIRKHIDNQIEAIKKTFIEGLNLPKYGNGDWDDTLQPVDKEKAKRMVSPWTSALLIQALEAYSKYDDKYLSLLGDMKKDYDKYLVKDGIVAGFIRFDDDSIKYLLHPEDKETGLKYRLLPITRNMISMHTKKEDIEKYLKIIDEHLKYPDGIRLMDNTVKYHGGKSDIFVRAESASNFGREISLLYVHAHIRYIEAMAKIGEKERVYEALNMVNPIGIRDTVKNAQFRQSSSYFSSSDAEFSDRYIANENIHKIKTGEVKVKGGWRVYSSGPGIYLYELIGNFFGLKMINDRILIDPSGVKELNDTRVFFAINNKQVEIRYSIKGNNLRKVKLNGKTVGYFMDDNIYRKSGISFEKSLLNKKNIIEVIYE